MINEFLDKLRSLIIRNNRITYIYYGVLLIRLMYICCGFHILIIIKTTN